MGFSEDGLLFCVSVLSPRITIINNDRRRIDIIVDSLGSFRRLDKVTRVYVTCGCPVPLLFHGSVFPPSPSSWRRCSSSTGAFLAPRGQERSSGGGNPAANSRATVRIRSGV